MDERQNPFSPGAGTPPPELAGRRTVLENAAIALARVKGGRHARSALLLGLRGVGKTVLLNEISKEAEKLGFEAVELEAPEDRRLAEILVPPLRRTLVRLSAVERAREVAAGALSVLRAFAAAFKVEVGDFSVGLTPGTADSGDLETDLADLFLTVARAGQIADRPIAVLVDEVQYLSEKDLAALIVALHKVSQKALPLVLFGAGLPQVAGLAGDAKSYAERLFEFPGVGPLAAEDARAAIAEPMRREGVAIEPDALDLIVSRTEGYPYFLQEWGAHTWRVAADSPVRVQDVEVASDRAVAALDQSFFRVRLDRLTPREKDYLRAMADLGPGPHRSGEVAQRLGIDVTTAGPLRAGLIRKGMIFSPQHGDTAFTVPMFDAFMRRAIPEWTPDASAAQPRQRKPRRKKR